MKRKVNLNQIRDQSIRVRDTEFHGLAIKKAITCHKEAPLSYSFIHTISIQCEHKSSKTQAQVALSIPLKVPGFQSIETINSLWILSRIQTKTIHKLIHIHILFINGKTDFENSLDKAVKKNSIK